jgi:hypothetical protein
MRKTGFLSGAFALALTYAGAAQALDARLNGAWATSDAQCKAIFETRGGVAAFKRGINVFDTAFIIRGGSVQGVNGSCRIGQSTPISGAFRIKLSCQDRIGFLPIDARVKVVSPTQITYGDFANDPLIDAPYVRCGK